LYGGSENFIFLRETCNTQVDFAHREAGNVAKPFARAG